MKFLFLYNTSTIVDANEQARREAHNTEVFAQQRDLLSAARPAQVVEVYEPLEDFDF